MKRTVILGIVSLLLSGCAEVTPMDRQLMDMGYPPDYAKGYKHGVCSGRHDVGVNKWYEFVRNAELYENNEQYRQGWDDGYEKKDMP